MSEKPVVVTVPVKMELVEAYGGPEKFARILEQMLEERMPAGIRARLNEMDKEEA